MLAELQQKKGTAGKFLYDPQLHDETLGMITDTRAGIAEAKKMLDDLNAGKGTAGKVLKDEEVYNQLEQISKKINVTMDKINSGQGTLGQFVTNPALYDSLNATSGEFIGICSRISALTRRSS